MMTGFIECGNIFFLLDQVRFVLAEINCGKLSFLNVEFLEDTNQYVNLECARVIGTSSGKKEIGNGKY